MRISVIKPNNEVQKEITGKDRIYLGFWEELEPGSKIVFSGKNNYYWIKVDTIDRSLVYLKENKMEYLIPKKTDDIFAYHNFRFQGDSHYFSMEEATKEEVLIEQNLCKNPLDQKIANGSYPHAFANVETRNESVFFASNAIDGICVNDNHGRYPYQSWGINRQADACLEVDFGRKVLINKIGLILRGDYPHDSFWTSVTVEFSNGDTHTFKTTNSKSVQYFKIKKTKTTSLKLYNLIKNNDESPFPALTQIEAFGKNIN